MKSKRIIVPGEPQGKSRPRFSRRGGIIRTYTPEKTAEYEELIRACWFQQSDGWRCASGGVGITVFAYFGIPKTATKASKQAMKSGDLRPAKRPDGDNILKVVCDALNNRAYEDDKQIVDARVVKLYSEEPRIEIVLFDIESEKVRWLP